MEKTTVYLTTEQKAALAAAAREQGRSEARLIRDGIEGLLAGHATREAPASAAGEPKTDLGDRGELGVRPRWVSREAFVGRFAGVQADPALRAQLRELAPDLTDEFPDR
ncbi:MAG TPA: hypothetical protein VFV53_08565 [Candidatus Limnocylindrales bacterium]|nr:hypothetical protein [Candidatus Limnocylindrales bacterium]